jgi:hypothetical protein
VLLELLGFQQQISPRVLAQEPQDIELLVIVFGPSPDTGFADLGEPFRTVGPGTQVSDFDFTGVEVAGKRIIAGYNTERSWCNRDFTSTTQE